MLDSTVRSESNLFNLSSPQASELATRLGPRRARAFADAAILSQLHKRLGLLEDLVGKLAHSLREIEAAPKGPRRSRH